MYRYWGKARQSDEAAEEPYHLLVYHSLDVAAVGQVLLEKHPLLRSRLATLMALPETKAQTCGTFLLGIHDLGKFAESFQQLRADIRKKLWPQQEIRKTGYSVRHDSLGNMLWKQYLRAAVFSDVAESLDDFVLDSFPFWLSAVFGHHGWPPVKEERIKNHFRDFDQRAALDFYQTWSALIQPDFERIAKTNAADPKHAKQASWLIAGIAVLSDWLGSNQDIFTFHSQPMDLETYWQDHALPQAKVAIEQAAILPPELQRGQSLKDFFPFIEAATPLQQTCSELPVYQQPQLFILEDVTGAGKTEAALILAHRLISAGQATGLYIGLPTMATANAMYERMIESYQRFYAEGEKPSLILSHSARHLSEKFQQSLLAAQRDDQDQGAEESITAQCNRWLADNRKKALLADVGIGTIDQALLGVMPARHQSLRLLGLVSKVLILDEVHAYDAYTSEPLKKLIQFHAALGGSIVLLSATLTQKQRQQFVSAFLNGKSVAIQRCEYPLLTQVSASGDVLEQPLATRESVRREVGVTFCHAETDVVTTIRSAIESGQCVCWIRNTVSDARSAWRMLEEAGWLDEKNLHLFHSRYALSDRIAIEQDMLGRFGKPDPESSQGSIQQAARSGQVLIATQVVEQSLDLDFDLMISDLAPIDLLIQRAGRLHRHQRGERGKPVLHIYAPELNDQPDADWYKASFPKANFVYPDTLVLWRSAKILVRKRGWKMPDDARDMLEYVYNPDGDIPPGLEETQLAIEGDNMGKKDAGAFASLKLASGYSSSKHWDEDARIATRLGEETHTLYLARWENGALGPWQNEGRYRWDLSSLRVDVRQIHRLVISDDAPWKAALEQLREKEKLFDEHSFILPLMQQGQDEWVGSVLNEHGDTVEMVYSRRSGMERRQ